MKHFYFKFLVITCILFASSFLHAQCELSQTTIDAGYIADARTVGNSFVATQTGAIESITYRNYNVSVSGQASITIHQGNTVANALGTSAPYNVPAGGEYTATFSPAVNVVAGQTYTFMIATSGYTRGFVSSNVNPYSDGQVLWNNAGNFEIASGPNLDLYFVITYADNTDPVFDTITSNEISATLDTNGNATVSPSDFGITATDNCPGSITYGLSQTAFDCSDIGANTIQYTATDASGNTATTNVIVTINGATPNVSLSTGNLTVTDLDDANDDYTIVVDGSNYRIGNATGYLIAGSGVTQDCDDILVPISSITGAITISGGNGNDVLTVDYSGGNFSDPINFEGGNQTGALGDALALTGGSMFASVTHSFVNENDGSIALSGNSLLTYTGLEPITDNLDAANRVFEFTGGAETITLSDDTTTNNNISFIDSTLGESVTFINPTNSLTINAGSGNDIINIQGTDTQFDAALTINGDDDSDRINFQINATDVGSGDLNGMAEIIFVSANINTTGDVILTADKNLEVNSSATITTTNGDIVLIGGDNPEVGDNFIGVRFNRGIVRTTGAGNIFITGTGAYSTSSFRHGVEIRNTGIIENTGSGSISIIGTGADGTNGNAGLFIFENDSRIASNGGGITINGTAGSGTGNNNVGVVVASTGIIRDLNGGAISITGIGNGNADQNYGVQVRDGALVTSSSGAISFDGQGSAIGMNSNRGIEIINSGSVVTQDGAINITGTGGDGTGNNNQGILVNNGVISVTGSGAVTLTGTGGAGNNNCLGVNINNTTITTSGSGITVNGTGANGTGNNNRGIVVSGTGGIRDTNGGSILLTGIGGDAVASGHGVQVSGANAYIETNNGSITINGSGGSGTGNSNQGIYITQATIQDLATGNIIMDGTGGNGAAFNRGIEIINGANILSNGGNINLSGTGGNGSGNFNLGLSIRNNAPTVSTTGSGTITVTGTSGVAAAANFGTELTGGAIVTTEDGNITLTGIGTDTTGGGQDGLRIDGTFTSTTGDIVLNGTSGTTGAWAIAFRSDTTLVQTGGDVTLNALNSERIVTVASVPAADLIEADTIFINGILRPGDGGRAQFPVSGDLILSSGDELIFNIAAFTTAGIDYDQLTVMGTVELTDATLTLSNNTGSAEDSCETIVLIDNDGFDPIIGTFNGVAEGASISSGGITGTISYTGGDGNDVVLNLDDTPPIVVCQDITVQLDTNGVASIVVGDVDGGSTDNCGIAFIVIDVDNFDCSNIGANNVVLTVTDVNGNSSNCTAIVTVEDVEPPAINCPADIVVNNDMGSCGAVVNDAPTATDNCSAFVNSITGFTFLGENQGKFFFTSNRAFTAPEAYADAIANGGFVATMENEEQNTFVRTAYSNAVSTGRYFIGYNDVATEGSFEWQSGSTSTYTNWRPDEPSTSNPNGKDYVEVRALRRWQTTVASTERRYILELPATGVIVQTEGIAPGEEYPVGVTTNTFMAIDSSGNTSTCSYTVTVEDNEAPTITCQNITIEVDETGTVTISPTDVTGVISDNCGVASSSIDMDTFDCSNVGDNTVTLTVTDVNGNASTCTATVTVEDNIAPTLACPSDIFTGTDPEVCGGTVVFADAVAFDNCSVASVVQTAGLPSGSVFPVGMNTVEFTATDVNGNTSVCSFTITVTDDEAPIAVCQDITLQLDAMGMATIVASDVDGGSTDNCGVDSLSIDRDTFTCADLGQNTVTLTVTDAEGLSSTCTAIVMVEDVTAPVVVCQDITVQLDAMGMVTIDPALLDGGSTDACGSGMFTYSASPDTFDCSNVGTNTVTLTVTDPIGNSSTCEATVTVVDNTAPTLTCTDITVSLDENGSVSIEASDLIADLDDACGIDTTAVDIDDFSCADIGTPVEVLVYASDVNGNISTCMATVTVVDELAPQLTCPADQTVNVDSGTQYELPDYFATGEATATDNCTDRITMTTQSPAAGSLLNPGVYTVTFTAEDGSGNVGTCEFELTVDEVLGDVNNSFDISSLTIYPNPARDYVVLSNPQFIPISRLEIFDSTGRFVKTIETENMGKELRVDTSELASAIYVLVIETPSGQTIKQLVKE